MNDRPGDVRSEHVTTGRIRTHFLIRGPDDGRPVLFVHGNVSAALFWVPTLAALPGSIRAIAPDLRGFGESEPAPVDARRGVRDFADDVAALITALGLAERGVDLVGWSLGGGVVQQLAIDRPGIIRSIVLVDPMSPYGFGGTRDVVGTPTWPDWAGSGAGTANPEFVARLRDGDRTADSPLSPRSVMNAFYLRPPFRLEPKLEDMLVEALLSTRVGDDHYPGDVVQSPNWPGVAPGERGVNNAISPKYLDLSAFASIEPRPPVLWIRGADDQIVSDASLFDFGQLGRLGAVAGWPGPDVYPAQPMIGQVRAVLDRYRKLGGRYREVILPDTGHSPHLERPAEFRSLLLDFLAETS